MVDLYVFLIKAMKNLSLLICLVIFAAGIDTFAQATLAGMEKKENLTFGDIKSAYTDYWNNLPENERKGWKQYKRWEYFWQRRLSSDGKFPGLKTMAAMFGTVIKNSQDSPQSGSPKWKILGPVGTPPKSTAGRSQGIGRVNVIRMNPANNNILWAGTALGGLWKSTNGGVAWQEIQFTQFLSLGISDIAINTSNPNIIYVATGDDDGSYGSQGFYSIGIIKSTDGGATWSQTGFAKNLDESIIVSRLILHPTKPENIIAATNIGIYKSTDGGATWASKQKDAAFYRDMEMNPSNPATIYASTFSWTTPTAIYRSMDEGETWEKIHEIPLCSRIELSVTRDDPAYVFALAAHSQTKGFHSLLVSTNQGNTWTVKYQKGKGANLLGWYEGTGGDTSGQGFYDLALAVSDLNKNEIYVGGVNIWKSTDGGTTWKRLTHWQNGSKYPFIHADHHELIFAKNSNLLFTANDGGIDKTTDGGKTWTNLNGNLSIMQFYRMGASELDTSLVIAGSQDNGTSLLKGKNWTHIYAADGFESAFDPTNDSICYCSIYYGSIFKSTNGGANFKKIIDKNFTKEDAPWLSPYLISTANPSFIYVGMENIWLSRNGGTSFNKISGFPGKSDITAIALSHTNPETIYASRSAKLYYSVNAGSDWSDITPPADNISYIALDPKNDKRIWATMGNFNALNKVHYYDGAKWINLTGNLPNVPVNCIAYQANSPDRIYIGTDIGVYYSDYNSAIWEPYNDGLPNVVVNELEINYKSGKIRAATYGRGIWEAPLITASIPEPLVTITGNTEFCEGDSVILSAPEGFSSYEWTNGEKTRQIVVRTSGIYTVVVTNNVGKAKSRAVEVIVKPVSKMSIFQTGINPMCILDTFKLKAGFGFSEYMWSNGEVSKEITVTEEGRYYVVGTASNGCKSCSDTIDVVILPPPDKPDITREGNTLYSTESQFYQWLYDGDSIPGATSRSQDIVGNGTYNVIVTVGKTCSAQSEPFQVLGISDAGSANDIRIIFNNETNTITIISPPVALGDISYRLMDINGRELITGSQAGNITLQTDGLARGIYYLLLNYNGKNQFFKVCRY
mgnify:CR=1 FL=1